VLTNEKYCGKIIKYIQTNQKGLGSKEVFQMRKTMQKVVSLVLVFVFMTSINIINFTIEEGFPELASMEIRGDMGFSGLGFGGTNGGNRNITNAAWEAPVGTVVNNYGSVSGYRMATITANDRNVSQPSCRLDKNTDRGHNEKT